MWMEFSDPGREGVGRSCWRSNGERGRRREEGRKGGDTYSFRRRKVRDIYHKKKKIFNTFKARAKAKNLIFHKEKKSHFSPSQSFLFSNRQITQIRPYFTIFTSPSSKHMQSGFSFLMPSHTHTRLAKHANSPSKDFLTFQRQRSEIFRFRGPSPPISRPCPAHSVVAAAGLYCHSHLPPISRPHLVRSVAAG